MVSQRVALLDYSSRDLWVEFYTLTPWSCGYSSTRLRWLRWTAPQTRKYSRQCTRCLYDPDLPQLLGLLHFTGKNKCAIITIVLCFFATQSAVCRNKVKSIDYLSFIITIIICIIPIDMLTGGHDLETEKIQSLFFRISHLVKITLQFSELNEK